MPTAVNPWLTRDPTPVETSRQQLTPLPTQIGPPQPQAGVPTPTSALHLPVVVTPQDAEPRTVGAYGGPGESSLPMHVPQ